MPEKIKETHEEGTALQPDANQATDDTLGTVPNEENHSGLDEPKVTYNVKHFIRM